MDAYIKPQETRYAPSKQRSKKGIKLESKTYSKLCGELNTVKPNLQNGDKATIRDTKNIYYVTADGYGGFSVNRIIKIKKEGMK